MPPSDTATVDAEAATKPRPVPVDHTRRNVRIAQFALVVGGVIIWELLTATGLVREFFIGRPTAMLEILIERGTDGRLMRDIVATTAETLMGFLIGTAGGFIGAVMLWWSPFMAKVVAPFAVALNALPKLALAPLFIIWFGLGFAMKVAISVSLVLLITFMIIFSAVQQIDGDHIDMARALGASRSAQFFKVVVPSVLPSLVTAMHINVGLALVGAVAAEFLASQRGLGHMALHGANTFSMSTVLAAIVVLLVIAYAGHLVLRVVARFLLPGRVAAEGDVWL